LSGGFVDEGNHFLGGEGSDTIWGAAGEDTFVYRYGDGYDQVYDPYYRFDIERLVEQGDMPAESLQQYLDGIDTLVFADGITADDITFSFGSSYMQFRLADNSGGITFQFNQYGEDHQLKKVEFADGAVWQRGLAQEQMALYQQVSNLAAAAAGFVQTSSADPSFTPDQLSSLPELLAVS